MPTCRNTWDDTDDVEIRCKREVHHVEHDDFPLCEACVSGDRARYIAAYNREATRWGMKAR